MLQKRVVALFSDLSKSKAKKIVVFCHGGVIRSILSHVTGTCLSDTKSFKIMYVAQVKLEKEDGFWRLSSLNSGV